MEQRRIAGVYTPTGIFAPNQVALLVTMVEEAFLEDLLVEPGAVEAGGQGQVDVPDEVSIGGGGVQAVGVEALIQDQSLEHGLAVDAKLHAIQADGTISCKFGMPVNNRFFSLKFPDAPSTKLLGYSSECLQPTHPLCHLLH